MNSLNKYDLPNDFEPELFEKGVSLEKFGLNEIGWKFRDVFKVIDFLVKNNHAILGGDIYIQNESTIKSTFDNWYLDRGDLDWDKYVILSGKKANEYLLSYSKSTMNQLDNYIVVLVYSHCKA